MQNAFNAGEFAPELDGRVDIGKYGSGCRLLENFIPMVQGPARRRAGTKFVAEVKNSAARTWLATFEFDVDEVYVLEFGHQYIRLFTDNGVVLGVPVGTWATATVYAAGRTVTEAGVDYYCITGHTSGATFAGDAAYWYAQPSTGEYEIPTPWGTSDLVNSDGTFALQMVQSGDVLFICHPDYHPRSLIRRAALRWTLTETDVEGGPFDTYDPDETTTVYASAATGSGVTLQSSTDIFASTDVGRLFYLESKKANGVSKWETGKTVALNDLRRYAGKTYKCTDAGTTGNIPPTHTVGAEYDGNDTTAAAQWEFQDPGYGWCEITAFTDANTVTATVLSRIPDQAVGVGNPSTRWAFGSWGSVPGYPTHVCFFRNRLCFARAGDRKLWFSVSADYENFRDRDFGGLVTADMAVTLTVEADQSANSIQYLVAGQNLVIGTGGGEYICSEMTDSDPFGPANATVKVASKFGSRGARPVQIGGSVLFVQRSGRRLREIVYDSIQDGYQSQDMSILAGHLVPKGTSIRQMAYQKEPHSVVWAARTDGLLLGFTFNREQFTEPPYGGWHRHQLGGDGIVDSLVCVPSVDNDRDDVWMIVRRTIGGVWQRYIERMMPEYEDGDDQADAFYVDCGLTYDGVAADTISGLDHLEGQTVDVLADGATHPQCVVTSGEITLNREASVVHVGYACPAMLQTLRIEAGATDGTAQGKTKRINRMVVRLMDTLGGEIGPSLTQTDEILYRTPNDDMDAAVPIFTGDKELAWPAGYEKEGYICFVQNDPLPATVVALMPQVTTQDR
jgi:hypothetical protein